MCHAAHGDVAIRGEREMRKRSLYALGLGLWVRLPQPPSFSTHVLSVFASLVELYRVYIDMACSDKREREREVDCSSTKEVKPQPTVKHDRYGGAQWKTPRSSLTLETGYLKRGKERQTGEQIQTWAFPRVLLAWFKAILLALIKEIGLCCSKVDNLWTAIPLIVV